LSLELLRDSIIAISLQLSGIQEKECDSALKCVGRVDPTVSSCYTAHAWRVRRPSWLLVSLQSLARAHCGWLGAISCTFHSRRSLWEG
jgi:hypothetical protein